MTPETDRTGAPTFHAFEIALEVIVALRRVLVAVRKCDGELAQQIVRAASSMAANLAEGNGRNGKDRVRFFRIAAGSAEETRAHLRVALAWGWVDENQTRAALHLLDRQLAMLWRLTH